MKWPASQFTIHTLGPDLSEPLHSQSQGPRSRIPQPWACLSFLSVNCGISAPVSYTKVLFPGPTLDISE